MASAQPSFDAAGPRVGIRRPVAADCDEFVAMALAGEAFHRPWVDPPKTRERFFDYLGGRPSDANDAFLVCDRPSGRIVGVVNVNCIVRGSFQSAYLGYYAAAADARRGYMTEGLNLVTRYAFTEMRLHRLEANIQPGNAASIALARRCGFRKEGFSPRYLRVAGEWRDHERWALLTEWVERPA